jgi:hypothetical protein
VVPVFKDDMDKVKPLKIENSANGGTEVDPFPTEADPSEDYLAARGIAFEDNDNRVIDTDGSGNLRFKDFTEAAYIELWKLRRAIYEIFNPSGSDLISTNSEDAIKEVRNKVITSASPGFSFGRSGVVTPNTYLQCETVPSNISGRWVYISSAVVKSVFITNELTTTYVAEIFYHDGNGVGLTSLGTVTVTSAKGNAFAVSFPVPTGKQLAVRINSGNPKNVVCGLELRGTA